MLRTMRMQKEGSNEPAGIHLDRMAATNRPLVGITLAAVPCPDTPVILTLHWHGFIKEKLADVEEAETVSYTPIPSSALQVNDRWNDLIGVDRAAMEAAWELGAWDVARAERPAACARAPNPAKRSNVCRRSVRSPTASTATRSSSPTRPMPTISCSSPRSAAT